MKSDLLFLILMPQSVPGQRFEPCLTEDPDSGSCVGCDPETEYASGSNWSYDVLQCTDKRVCSIKDGNLLSRMNCNIEIQIISMCINPLY